MLAGRSAELLSLQNSFSQRHSTLTILYGRAKIGKTALVKEFIKDKACVYYKAVPASEKGQLELFDKAVDAQTDDGTDTYVSSDYAELFSKLERINSEVKVLVIEEFQNIVKHSKEFMDAVSDLVKGEYFTGKVMVICTSSSICWVENNMVSAIGNNAFYITSFLKLKELSFVDTVRMFPDYSVTDCLLVYAITGGVAGLMKEIDPKLSIRDNICRNILTEGKLLRNYGSDYVGEELRDTSLYSTILYCIANGEDKLNQLHSHTGFGRDKISVYLKNLIEREIVYKVFSFDADGNEHTKKGLYRIKAGFIEFWYRFIYSKESQLEILGSDEFYVRYIEPYLDSFAAETFVKVSTEFIELMDSMGKLPFKIERHGRWWGKNGNIDIIASDDAGHYIIGKCNWPTDIFTFEMFEKLMYNVNLADVGKNYIYLFSKDTFDEELQMFAKDNENVNLISLNDF